MPTPSGVDEFDLDKQDSETTAQKEQQQDNPEAATEGEAASAPTAPPDKQTDSDTESIARGDISQPTQPKEGRKTRDRKAKPTQEAPAKIDGDRGLWGGGGPLDQLDEAGSPVKGAGELVPGGAKDNAGKTLSGLTGGGGKRDGKSLLFIGWCCGS